MTLGGLYYGDEDALEGIIAHEMHHLIKFDALPRSILKNPKTVLEVAQQQEIDADAFANLYSKTACKGRIKNNMVDSELDDARIIRYGMIHLKPKARKVCAETYGKSIWGLEPSSVLLENYSAERDLGIISMYKREYTRRNIRKFGVGAVAFVSGWILGGVLTSK